MHEAFHPYNKAVACRKDIFVKKMKGYSSAWGILRMKGNKGKTIISESIDANYYGIINYAIFALIKPENHTTSRLFEFLTLNKQV